MFGMGAIIGKIKKNMPKLNYRSSEGFSVFIPSVYKYKVEKRSAI
jgi:hypothetical protein